MLDLSKYQSIGQALKDALDQFANEACLIEADREREKERLTYRDFKERAHPLARALQDGGFTAGDRAGIIMTNQSKWLISAYAIFFAAARWFRSTTSSLPTSNGSFSSIPAPACSSRNIPSGGSSALLWGAWQRQTYVRSS